MADTIRVAAERLREAQPRMMTLSHDLCHMADQIGCGQSVSLSLLKALERDMISVLDQISPEVLRAVAMALRYTAELKKQRSPVTATEPESETQ